MLNINGEDWRIIITSSNHPALMRPTGEYTLGCCDTNTNTIYITEGLTDKYFQKVLCHELVHASMASYNVILNEFQEEVLADLMSTYGQEIIHITNSLFSRLSQCKKNKGKSCILT